jgi:inner membrane protein
LDNLTHSLVGLLAAEAVIRVRERSRPLADWSRSAVYVISIVGNNLPDLDFSYSRISGKTFGYLLQHRGYTHTVPEPRNLRQIQVQSRDRRRIFWNALRVFA